MNTVPTNATGNSLNRALGLVATLVVVAVLSGFNERFHISASSAFWLLFTIGFIMCALGPLRQGGVVGWGNPRHVAGYTLGAAALLLATARLFDFSLPFIQGARSATAVLSVLMASKILIGRLYPGGG